MVGKGELRDGSALRGGAEERSGERRVDGGAYTLADSRHFEGLSDFSGFDAEFGFEQKHPAANEPPVSRPGTVDYSARDEREFEQLMQRLGGPHGRSAKPRSRAPSPAGGYAASDDVLFAELMAPDRFPAGSRSAESGRDPAGVPDASHFQYTRRDIEAFQKIMPDPAVEVGQENDDRRPLRPDRDVGPIRIVEFDKEQARQKQAKRRGVADIKVRYFD